MPLEILYFAWVRDRIGVPAERIELPADIATVADLIGHLESRSPGHAAALKDRKKIRAALDQTFVPLSAPLSGAKELAIFPPVTGG